MVNKQYLIHITRFLHIYKAAIQSKPSSAAFFLRRNSDVENFKKKLNVLYFGIQRENVQKIK